MKTKQTQLLLVRHGESVWNAVKRLQGQQDLPLSVRGRRQAELLAPLVRSYGPTRVVCSDLLRARETAELLGYAPERFDVRLRESSLGEWEGASIAELREQRPEEYRGWRDGRFDPPGAETFGQFYERVGTALGELRGLGESVLVVSHGGVVRAALNILLGITPEMIIPSSPASLTVIDLSGPPRLRAYNLTAYEALLDVPD